MGAPDCTPTVLALHTANAPPPRAHPRGRVAPTRRSRTAPRTRTAPTHSAAQRTLTGVRRVQFNLESEELLTVRDELEEWRQDMAQPLQLDIMLQTVRHRARTEEEQAGPRTGCHPHA